jgi:hypothetical protein
MRWAWGSGETQIVLCGRLQQNSPETGTLQGSCPRTGKRLIFLYW